MNVTRLSHVFLPLGIALMAASCHGSKNPKSSSQNKQPSQSQNSDLNNSETKLNPLSGHEEKKSSEDKKEDDCLGKVDCSSGTPNQTQNDVNATPVVEENSTPVVEENLTPVVEENSTPVVEENSTPVVEENSTPVVEENSTPVVEENSGNEQKDTDALATQKLSGPETNHDVTQDISESSLYKKYNEYSSIFGTKTFEVTPDYKIAIRIVPFVNSGNVNTDKAHIFIASYKFKDEPISNCFVSKEKQLHNKNYIRLENFSHIVANLDKSKGPDELIALSTEYRLFALLQNQFEAKNKNSAINSPLISTPFYERFSNTVNLCSFINNRHVEGVNVTDKNTREKMFLIFLEEELTSDKIQNLKNEFKKHYEEYELKNSGLIFPSNYSVYAKSLEVEQNGKFKFPAYITKEFAIRINFKSIEKSFSSFLIDDIDVYGKEGVTSSLKSKDDGYVSANLCTNGNSFYKMFGAQFETDTFYNSKENFKVFNLFTNSSMVFKDNK